VNARRQIIAALSEDSHGGIATLHDVERAEQLVDAVVAEALAEVINPADAATLYAVRTCVCDETPHPTWCPASVPTDERITEIRQGLGGPLTLRELSWIKGAAGRHELHVTGSRGGHWPLTDDLPGALLLVSQYLAAAVAVIERAGLVEEKATAAAASAAPDFYEPGHTYSDPSADNDWKFRVDAITTHPEDGERTALGWRHFRGEWAEMAYGEDDFEIHLLAGMTDGGGQ
jgi:hypothetical protein